MIWNNVKTIHHRIMARYLKRKGWVVFYLEERDRSCGKDMCWLKLYLAGEKKEGAK